MNPRLGLRYASLHRNLIISRPTFTTIRQLTYSKPLLARATNQAPSNPSLEVIEPEGEIFAAPDAEKRDPNQIGDYPQDVPWVKAHTKDPYGKYFDRNERRNFGETVRCILFFIFLLFFTFYCLLL